MIAPNHTEKNTNEHTHFGSPCGDINIAPQHWIELTEGSGIRPDIARLNFTSMEGQSVIEFLAGAKLDSTGAYGKQYVTGQTSNILARYQEPAAGGFRDIGLDPDTWEPASYGRFKADTPRIGWKRDRKTGEWKEDGTVKYDSPAGVPFRVFYPRVSVEAGYQIAKSIGMEKHYAAQVGKTFESGSQHQEEDADFWEWYLSLSPRQAPVTITEGAKKTCALISVGIAAIGLPGVTMWHRKGESELHPDISHIATKGRAVTIAFDEDEKITTANKVGWQAIKFGEALEAQQCKVLVATWPQEFGKGIDDVLVAQGHGMTRAIIQSAPKFVGWRKHFRTTKALGMLAHSRQVSIEPERDTEGEYLPELPALASGAIHVVDATMNTGKTYRIGRDWVKTALAQGIKVLCLSPLNSLGKQTANDWGIFHIHDQLKAEDKKEFWEQVQARPGIVLCPDSIGKLPQWFFDGPLVIIVDEGNQVTHHICQGETLKSRYGVVLPQIEEAAQHAIASGGAIVLAEDGIPDRAIKFWQSISGATSTRYFRHRKQGEPWPTTLYSGAVSGFRGRLLERLHQPEPLFFVSASQRECKRLERIASAMGKSAVRIDSETNEGGAYELFFSDPDAWIGSNRPDVLIISPSGKSGLSIQGRVSAEDAYFKDVWAYFPALDTDTHMQQLGRYRPSVSRHIYCPPFIAGDADEQLGSQKKIKNRLATNINHIAKLFALQGNDREATRLEVAVQDYLAEAFTISGTQKSIAQSALMARLEDSGHTISTEHLEGNEEAAQTWKDFQELIWAEEAAQFAAIEVEDGQTPDWAWATLDSMESTHEARQAARKVLWRDAFPGIKFDNEELCYEALFKDYGKMRRGVQLLARVENLEAAKEQDAAAAQAILDSPVRSGHRVPKNYAKALLLERIGVLDLLTGGSWDNSDARAIKIWEKCTGYSYQEYQAWKHAGALAGQRPERSGKDFTETIYYWLRLQVKPSQTPAEICNKLVRKFGLTVKGLQRPGGGNSRDRIYGITDLDNPFRLQLLAAARGKLSGEASTICNEGVALPMRNVDASTTPPERKDLPCEQFQIGDIVTWVGSGILALIERIENGIAHLSDEEGQEFAVPLQELFPLGSSSPPLSPGA